MISLTNEQRLLSAFEDTSFSKYEAGGIIELTEDELRDICSGKIPAPQVQREHDPNLIIFYQTKEHADDYDELAYSVFEHKRFAFFHRYGVLQPDGTRSKHYIV